MREKQIENQIKHYLKLKDIWYFKIWGGRLSNGGHT